MIGMDGERESCVVTCDLMMMMMMMMMMMSEIWKRLGIVFIAKL